MKKRLGIGFAIMMSLCFVAGSSFAVGWGNYGTSPSEVVDRVVGEANPPGEKTQETQLDRISDAKGQFPVKYKIANTLDSLRQEIAPYLQWFMFIGLSIATVMIIITGFQLVISIQSGEDTKKAATRIKNIAIGIIVMTGFYIITRLFMSLVAYVLQ